MATLCIWVGRRGTVRLAQGHNLAAEVGQPATHPHPLSGPLALGGRVESANGLCPLTHGVIEDLA